MGYLELGHALGIVDWGLMQSRTSSGVRWCITGEYIHPTYLAYFPMVCDATMYPAVAFAGTPHFVEVFADEGESSTR